MRAWTCQGQSGVESRSCGSASTSRKRSLQPGRLSTGITSGASNEESGTWELRRLAGSQKRSASHFKTSSRRSIQPTGENIRSPTTKQHVLSGFRSRCGPPSLSPTDWQLALTVVRPYGQNDCTSGPAGFRVSTVVPTRMIRQGEGKNLRSHCRSLVTASGESGAQRADVRIVWHCRQTFTHLSVALGPALRADRPTSSYPPRPLLAGALRPARDV